MMGINAWILIGGLTTLALGVWLLRRGWWPKRTGDTPHCRKCDYIVTGNSSGVCPECGSPLFTSTVILGERRPYFSTRGVLLCFLSAAQLATAHSGVLDRVDWYRHRPFFLVMGDLKSPQREIWNRAWIEIQRRRDAGDLSSRQENALVARAMSSLADPTPNELTIDCANYLCHLVAMGRLPSPQRDVLIDLAFRENNTQGPLRYQTSALSDLIAAECALGRLSSPQEEQYLKAGGQLALEVRSRVEPGDVIPYRICLRPTPPPNFMRGNGPLNIYVDGRELSSSEDLVMRDGLSDGIYGFLPHQSVGSHHVRIRLQSNVKIPNRVQGTSEIQRSCVDEFSGSFEVVPEPTVKIRALPAASELAKYIDVSRVTVGDHLQETIWLSVDVKPPPVGLAFDVAIRVDGTEFPVNGVWRSREGRSGLFAVEPGEASFFPIALRWKTHSRPKRIDLLLRSNLSIAKRQVRLDEMWAGDLSFPDLPIEHNSNEDIFRLH
jgi:hypothetical protein